MRNLSTRDAIWSTVALVLAIAPLAGCPADDDDGGLPVGSDATVDVVDLSSGGVDITDLAPDVVDTANVELGPDVADDSGGTGQCDTGSPSGLMSCVDSDRYWTDLVVIAHERTPGSTHWQAVQDLCASRFEALGFAVERHDYGSGVNVIGRRTGLTRPAEQVLVSAHYDHISGCDGADDNASGVAGVLELARVLSSTDFDRTLVVACWDEEETGLLGSTAYAERADEAGDDIVVTVVLDMIGYASDEPNSQEKPDGIELLFPQVIRELEENESRGDFLAVLNGSDASAPANAIDTYGEAVGLPVAVFELNVALLDNPLLSDFLRSDHAPFWALDYPALLVSDTADLRNPYYHCRGGEDAVGTLDREFAIRSVRALVAAVAETLDDTAD